jgi:hypothetical protein
MSYVLPHPTYVLERELDGVPYGTMPREHITTGGPILVCTVMHEHGCKGVYDTTVGELQQLAIGQVITRLAPDFRYVVTREA